MPGLSLRMWCITFSPEGDISDERVEAFMGWLSKHAKRWRVITEMGEGIKKHLHAIVLFNQEKEKRNLRTSLETLFVMSNAEKGVFRAVRRKWGQVREALHGAWNHEYYSNYLHKNGSEKKYGGISEVVSDTWCSEEAEEHYVEPAQKDMVNGKFLELYKHWNGEKNLAAWVDSLVVDDVIDYAFIPVSGKKDFLRLFGLWAKARGRYQEKTDP